MVELNSLENHFILRIPVVVHREIERKSVRGEHELFEAASWDKSRSEQVLRQLVFGVASKSWRLVAGGGAAEVKGRGNATRL